jgi:hypothetical protein
MPQGLLDGKKGLVLNIANDRSIACHIANNAIKHGAACGFGFLPMEKIIGVPASADAMPHDFAKWRTHAVATLGTIFGDDSPLVAPLKDINVEPEIAVAGGLYKLRFAHLRSRARSASPTGNPPPEDYFRGLALTNAVSLARVARPGAQKRSARQEVEGAKTTRRRSRFGGTLIDNSMVRAGNV